MFVVDAAITVASISACSMYIDAQFIVGIDFFVEMTGLDQVMITVPHVLQRFRWDCGLACSQMVLRFVSTPL